MGPKPKTNKLETYVALLLLAKMTSGLEKRTPRQGWQIEEAWVECDGM
jgi:hypothetical protein